MEQFEQSEVAEFISRYQRVHPPILVVGLADRAGGPGGRGAAYFVSNGRRPSIEASTKLLVSAPSSIGGTDPTALVTTRR